MLPIATSAWTVVGALGAAVGGIGAAVGAFAAWRAADASSASSRDALEALGLSIAPTITGDAEIAPFDDDSGRCQWSARIFNTSGQLAASQLTFEAGFADGYRMEQSLERLAAAETWKIPMREIDMPPAGPAESEAGTGAVLRYSDERQILRYELEFGFLVGKRGDGSDLPSISMMVTGEPHRISPSPGQRRSS